MPEFRKAFDSVQNQIIIGNAHLKLWKSLGKRISGQGNIIASTAPTFFGMTLDAHLNAAFLCAARVFDTHRDALTIHTILRKARHEMSSLSPAAGKTLRESLAAADAQLVTLESTVDSVRVRRDNFLAHLDFKVIKSPDRLTEASKITVKELEDLFQTASQVLNQISGAFWEVSSVLDLVDIDDFEHPLALIERQKEARTRGIRGEVRFDSRLKE